MITVENLSFGYKKGKKSVLQDFSLSIGKGKICGLLGKNGAGKSTLLYLMSGLLTPAQGKVLYHGVDVRLRLPQTLNDLYLVPEEFELPSVSLEQYIKLNAPFYPRFSREDLMRNLQLFEMEGDLNLGGLSMGQKKKVLMSFALAANTSLLLMDEPTNGLDIPGKSQFRKLIVSGMTEERCVMISTHQVRDIEQLLEHVVIVDESNVLLNASVSDICEKIYFTETDNEKLVQQALCVLPSFQGNSVMLPNHNSEESDLNLELLFNGVLANRKRIYDLFNS